MSPRRLSSPSSQSVVDAERRLWLSLGTRLRDYRLSKRMTVADVARRASLSTDVVYLVEAGQSASTEAVMRIVVALGLRLDFAVTDPRRKVQRPGFSSDVVHSAMGEFEAAHFRGLGLRVGLDEPYQHYQFAGRADLVAWDVDAQALLHIENRTRFPDFQEMAGAYNAKRAYLGHALADRMGVRRWKTETHVIAALWSSEVLHALRVRTNSFRALCPDSADAVTAWWTGERAPDGAVSTLIVLDPITQGRKRAFVSLNEAVGARPRYRGYFDAAEKLEGRASTKLDGRTATGT